MTTAPTARNSVPHLPFILMSIGAAGVTVALKFGAYGITGSVGLLSDAVESTGNVVAAFTAFFALWYAAHPADRSHPYGHEKIEFLSIGLEGSLILTSAMYIVVASARRLMHPQPLVAVDLGLWLVLGSIIVNYAVGQALLARARAVDSIVLEADGRHLLADVWTSLGVICGLGLALWTHRLWFDPLVGLCVACNIARIGLTLMRRSFDGLMDSSLSDREVRRIRAAIESEINAGMTYHALRTRRAGAHRFVDFHLLVPGGRTVAEAHGCEMAIGRAIQATLPNIEVTTHIEPIEEPLAWNDSRMADDPDVPAQMGHATPGNL